MAKPRTRLKALAGAATAVLLLLVAWFWLKAEADVLTSGELAPQVPRSGMVTTIDGGTLTLAGSDGTFTVTVGDLTVVREADAAGLFQVVTRSEIAIGQLATVTAEIPGAPAGAIDLVRLGGAQ